MAEKKDPAKKKVPRIQTITHAFVKGLAQATAKHAGPEAATKLVEGIQRLGEAWGPKSAVAIEKPAEPEQLESAPVSEPELDKESLSELEELIKVSEGRTEDVKEAT